MSKNLKVFSYGRYVLNNPIRIKEDRINAIKKFYQQFDKIEKHNADKKNVNGNSFASSRSSWIR